MPTDILDLQRPDTKMERYEIYSQKEKHRLLCEVMKRIDPPIRPLIKRLNVIRGISTLSCCSGHFVTIKNPNRKHIQDAIENGDKFSYIFPIKSGVYWNESNITFHYTKQSKKIILFFLRLGYDILLNTKHGDNYLCAHEGIFTDKLKINWRRVENAFNRFCKNKYTYPYPSPDNKTNVIKTDNKNMLNFIKEMNLNPKTTVRRAYYGEIKDGSFLHPMIEFNYNDVTEKLLFFFLNNGFVASVCRTRIRFYRNLDSDLAFNNIQIIKKEYKRQLNITIDDDEKKFFFENFKKNCNLDVWGKMLNEYKANNRRYNRVSR